MPNVAGRLSFSHVGQTRHPSPCTTLNEDDGEGRNLVCTQKRKLSDALIAAPYMRWVYGYDPTWVFAFVANSDKAGPDRIGLLRGQVFLFNMHRWRNPPVDAHSHGEGSSGPSPREAMQQVEDYVDAVPESGEPQSHGARLRERMAGLKQAFAAHAVVSFDCTVSRFGEVHVSPSADPVNVLFAPSVTERPRELSPKDLRYLANQAYFFIKDISHEHRHHHKKSDTITSAHLSDDAKSWARETQYSMHRHVVALARRREARSHYNALGMLAYMQAFDKKIESLSGLPGAEIALSYNISEMENSIKARTEYFKWRRVQLNILLTAVPALIIALMSVMNQQSKEVVGSLFLSLKHIFAIIFSDDIFGFMSFVAVLSSTPFLYGAFNPLNSGAVFNAKRILTVWPRRRQVGVWWALAILSALLACAVIYISINNRVEEPLLLAWLVAVIALIGFPVGVSNGVEN